MAYTQCTSELHGFHFGHVHIATHFHQVQGQVLLSDQAQWPQAPTHLKRNYLDKKKKVHNLGRLIFSEVWTTFRDSSSKIGIFISTGKQWYVIGPEEQKQKQ